MNAIALLQQGCSKNEVSKLLGTSRSTCFGIPRECAPHVEPSRGGHPISNTMAHRQTCVRAIIIGEPHNVLDVGNALSECLNLVGSINMLRCVLQQKQKKPLLMPKNMCCIFEFAQHDPHWTIND